MAGDFRDDMGGRWSGGCLGGMPGVLGLRLSERGNESLSVGAAYGGVVLEESRCWLLETRAEIVRSKRVVSLLWSASRIPIESLTLRDLSLENFILFI